MAVSENASFMETPVLHRGERVGSIFLTEKEHGREFTREEETLFASRPAMETTFRVAPEYLCCLRCAPGIAPDESMEVCRPQAKRCRDRTLTSRTERTSLELAGTVAVNSG